MNIFEIMRWKISRFKFKIISKSCKYKFIREGYDIDWCKKISKQDAIFTCDDCNCPYTKNVWLEGDGINDNRN